MKDALEVTRAMRDLGVSEFVMNGLHVKLYQHVPESPVSTESSRVNAERQQETEDEEGKVKALEFHSA